MLVFGFIFLSIALIGLCIYIAKSKDNHADILVYLCSSLIIGFILIISHFQEKETAIKALKGNNPYTMEIRYELKDSVYVPVDTIYIKK